MCLSRQEKFFATFGPTFLQLRQEINVLEAWGDSVSSAKLNWLLTDQLATPRMVIDKTGSLTGVKRHDYLPFGEELFAGAGVAMVRVWLSQR